MRKRISVEELLGETTVSPDRRATSAPGPSQPSGGSGVGDDLAIAGGAYEGTDQFSRELATWRPSFGSADRDLLPAKPLANSRSRDIIRNDAFVQGAVSVHKDNIVGPVYKLNAKPLFRVVGLDEDWAEEFQVEVEEKFTLWSESLNCWADVQRTGPLTDMIRMAVAQSLQGGEVLAVAEYIRGGGRPFRTAIQMIDPDRLSNPYNANNYKDVRGGIRFDRLGQPLTYYIRESHPTEFLQGNNHEWRAVPARKPWGRQQVIHLFEQNRPGQSRGISELVAALKELRITKRFREIALQNAVLNATFAATIESSLPDEAFAALGGQEGPEGVTNYATELLSALDAYHGGGNGITLNNVRIPHLFPGTKLNLLPAGKGGPLGSEFEQSLLRYIAAGLGVSYEQLSRDFTQTNYSSARAAINETWKYMQSRKRLVADRFATHVYALWLEEAISNGHLESMKGVEGLFYEPLAKEALTNCMWIGASCGQIDELKETQAAVLRLKYNLSTEEIEAGRLGVDWRDLHTQREREIVDSERRGLVTQQDNSINAASGSPQERQASDEPADGSEDNTDV